MNTKFTEAQNKIKSGELSVRRRVEEFLKRIEQYDGELNSFITVVGEEAIANAQKLDQLYSEKGESVFDEMPLFGLVFSAKDMYLTEGVKTTAGSKLLSEFIPPYSSTVIKKLLAAGAILIGKTNQDAWAHGSSGENSDFGVTKNPWDKSRVPGGSSSGAAVSVSAGFCDFAMGTDTGGSVRLPAAFTNVVGFKPTYGAISRYGVIAMASSLDTMGNFAVNSEDSKRVFDVVRGEDGFDQTVENGDLAEPKKVYTIGIPKEYFSEGLDPKVEKLVRTAIEKITQMGHKVLEVELPSTDYAISAYYVICPAEVSSNLGRYDGVRMGLDRGSFGDEAKRRIMLGTYVLESGYVDAYYNKAIAVRDLIRNEFKNAFSKVDLMLAPVSPSLPFKLGEKSNDPLSMYLADVYTVAINIAGVCALSVPCGFSEELPVGLQIIGPRFGEQMVFDLARSYQEITDSHLKSPNL
jgi:aspartyl-tRNA(Asn)/glutamyl-tRNA(Gln) amidotransferase subunit A